MMFEHASQNLSRTGIALAWFVLMAGALGQPLIPSAVAQRRPLTKEQILSRIRRAHIPGKVPKSVFNSFLFSGCMRIEQSLLPKNKANTDTGCIMEETGVLQPSHAYVSVAVGPTRITELVDIKQGKGWQIVDPTTFSSSNPSRTMAALHKMKYDALVESSQHSLSALLALLQNSAPAGATQLAVNSDGAEIVLTWRTEQSLNEFFFNRTTFLCEKQVRTIGKAKSIMQYSDYKRVGSVVLPYTIVAAKEDGTRMATREIRKWELATQWPDNHFQPENIRFAQ